MFFVISLKTLVEKFGNLILIMLSGYCQIQIVSHLNRSVKSQGKTKFVQGHGKVSEFFFGQGNFEPCSKSGKSQGNIFLF